MKNINENLKDNQAEIILGIDPGLRIIGWSIVSRNFDQLRLSGYGCLKTNQNISTPERLVEIHEFLKKIVDEYQPTRCAIEKVFINRADTLFHLTRLVAPNEVRARSEATQSFWLSYFDLEI